MTLSFREAISFAVIEELCPEGVFDGKYHLQHDTMALQVGPLSDTRQPDIPQVKTEPDGITLRSESGDVLDLHTTHVNLHLFTPYKGWDYLANEFLEIQQNLRTKFSDIQASEISIRYINELKMPLGANKEFGKYLLVSPNWPVEMPDKLGQFFIQINTRSEEQHLNAVFNEAIKRDESSPAGFSVILDITVNCREQSLLNFKSYWPLMELMRNYKNALFEGAITPEMAQTFNQTIQ